MNFLEYATEVLKESTIPLTYQEIWEKGMEKKLDLRLNSTGKTPAQTIGARLYVDVKNNENSKFITVGSRPVRFFLKAKESQIPENLDDLLDAPKDDQASKYREKQIYLLVTYFVYANPAFTRGKPIWTKTINHEKSKNKSTGYSEWNHPDIVGFYLPLDNWDKDIIELNKISDNNALKLYSFEVKKKIEKSNYKEAFFQAVSNSSWAHEGYLVAAEIQEDEELLSELGRLSSSFGIGVIHLDLKDIDSSQILFPARINPLLDWETMSKLFKNNSDFEKFITNIKEDFDAKRINKEAYNEIIDSPENYVNEQKIL